MKFHKSKSSRKNINITRAWWNPMHACTWLVDARLHPGLDFPISINMLALHKYHVQIASGDQLLLLNTAGSYSYYFAKEWKVNILIYSVFSRIILTMNVSVHVTEDKYAYFLLKLQISEIIRHFSSTMRSDPM